MDKSKGTVTIDAEWLLNRIESAERAIADIRNVAAQGVKGRPTLSGININLLEWKIRGSKPAREDDDLAWAFSCDPDGYILDEARQLVEEIERLGKVEVAGYEISLGGRDNKLLNRKKLKRQERRR